MNAIKNKIKIIFFSIIILLIAGCPEPPQNPPDPPLLVAKSPPGALLEQGIDVEIPVREQTIVLMWYPNTETDIAGYKIYRNPDIIDSSFHEIKDISIGSINSVDTVYYDETVQERIEYHYFIKAYNNAKEKSEPSDTVRYKLGTLPELIFPDDEVVKRDKLKFGWYDIPYRSLFSNEYVIRVQERETNLLWEESVWVARFTNRWYGSRGDQIVVNYFDSNPPFPGPSGHVISCYGKYDQLPSGEYRWKIKTIIELDNDTDLDIYGSESTWNYFSIE